MTDKEITKRYDIYLIHRYKRFVSSGCCLCWDVCSCFSPIMVEEEERRAYHGKEPLHQEYITPTKL